MMSVVAHVRHVPRKSSWESDMADRMTRIASMHSSDKELLRQFEHVKFPVFFTNWIREPIEDWSICTEMLKVVDK